VTRRRLAPFLALLALACRQDMHDQPKLKPYAASGFFADERGSRQHVAGTVARGQLREDPLLFTGKQDGKPAAEVPFPLTLQVLERGQQRYLIYCTPCHGQTGRGDGIVVRRGYRKPTSFHDARLRGEPVGYYYDVVTNGFGAMPDYQAQLAVRDRWAVAAYVKALQLSQYADAKQLGIQIPAEPAK
jgi:hypothetical protein